MSLGIVSDSDFESEIDSLSKKDINSSIIDIHKGRGNQLEVPDSLRQVIGENAIEEGNQNTKLMTRAFGLSDSSLSAYKAGATSTTSYHNPTFKDHIDKARKRITAKARNRLIMSLNHITDEKLAEEKPRDLAGIAKEMSVIIRNMEPDSVQEKGSSGPTFVLYAPQFVKEDRYEVIDLKE